MEKKGFDPSPMSIHNYYDKHIFQPSPVYGCEFLLTIIFINIPSFSKKVSCERKGVSASLQQSDSWSQIGGSRRRAICPSPVMNPPMNHSESPACLKTLNPRISMFKNPKPYKIDQNLVQIFTLIINI